MPRRINLYRQILPLCFFVLSCLFGALCKAKGGQKRLCDATEIKQKSCFLHYNKYKLHINDNKLRLTDSIWRSVHDFEPNGEAVEWHRLKLLVLGSHLLLDFKVWVPVEGEVELSSLKWRVFQIEKEKIVLKIDRTLQKRRILPDVKKSYFDPIEKHGLKKGSKGRIHWWHGREKGYW